jgi:hypothetical protein
MIRMMMNITRGLNTRGDGSSAGHPGRDFGAPRCAGFFGAAMARPLSLRTL